MRKMNEDFYYVTPPQTTQNFVGIITRAISPYELPSNYPQKIESYLKEYGSVLLLAAIENAKRQYLYRGNTPKIDKFLEKLGGVLYYQARPLMRLIYICSDIMSYKSSGFDRTSFLLVSKKFMKKFGCDPEIKGGSKERDIPAQLVDFYLSFILNGDRIGIFNGMDFPDWDLIDLYLLLKDMNFKPYSESLEEMLDFLIEN